MQTPGGKPKLSQKAGIAGLVAGLTLLPRVASAQFFASIADSTFGNLFEWLMILLFTIVAKITDIIGAGLDYAVESFVVNMAGTIEGIGAIDQLWQLFRDLGNIVFIAILLYAAISIILGTGNKIQAKQVVINLVIVALFVNFSLFATKALVDTANITALQFYNSIQVVGCEETDCDNLSNFFYGSVNISSLNSTAGLEDTTNTAIGFARLLGAFLLAVLAFVMGAAAILLGMRFVTLILLMIASPLAFISFIMPDSKKLGKQWLNALLDNAFFAPAMFAMIYIAARVAKGVQAAAGEDGGDLMAAVVNPDGDTFEALMVYFVVIAFLIASIIVAKKMGAVGASKAVSYGEKARDWGQAKVRGAAYAPVQGAKAVGRGAKRGAGVGARKSFGRLGNKLDKKFASSKYSQTLAGKYVRDKTTKKMKDAEYGTGKTFQKAQNEKEGRKKRYNAIEILKDGNASDDDKRDELKKLTRGEKLGLGEQTLKNNAHLIDENTIKAMERDDDKFSENYMQDFKRAVGDNLSGTLEKFMKEMSSEDFSSLSDDEKEKVKKKYQGKVKDFLANRSDDQLKELNQDLVTNQFVVNNMSDDQISKAKKGRSKDNQDDIDDVRLQPLREANQQVASGANPNAVREYFGNKKDKEIASQIKLAIKNNDKKKVMSSEILDEIGPSEISEMGGMKSKDKEVLRQMIINKASPEGSRGNSKIDRAADYIENGPGAAKF